MSQADELKALGLSPDETSGLEPAETQRWLEALGAALRPGELSAQDNERLIARALDDPLAPPSEEELAESARLRDALASGGAHEDAPLLEALRAPFAASEAESATEVALAKAQLRPAPSPKRRSNVVYATFGVASLALAAAAALVLSFGGLSREAAPAAPPLALARPRSAAPLFDGHFDSNTTARVDLIVSVRSRDLRDNRYAAWGVR
ncbi:MAG TPA: hypothetical protein VHB79_38600 [Polyangiaceae bacterium]|nr:hypothetical protein [Polyangiaceae bacterium]